MDQSKSYYNCHFFVSLFVNILQLCTQIHIKISSRKSKVRSQNKLLCLQTLCPLLSIYCNSYISKTIKNIRTGKEMSFSQQSIYVRDMHVDLTDV